MRWARVRIPRKTSEAVRIWQCKWSRFRNLTVSVMGVVRGWHHLTFAAAVPYVPPALNHCTRSERINTTLRDWRCRPHVIAILRVRHLRSQGLHHDSWTDRIAAVRVDRLSVSGHPWAAFPEGPRPLSDQNRKTCNVTFQKPSCLLIIKPSCLFYFFLPCPCSYSRLDVVWFFANSKCVPTSDPLQVLFPLPGSPNAHVYLPPSSLSQRRGHLRGLNAFFDHPDESGIFPSSTSFHHSTWNVCVFVFWPWNLFLYLSFGQFPSLELMLTSLSPTPGIHRRCFINIWSM